MKIIFDKKIAEQKQKEVEKEYFKKAKRLHINKKIKGIVSVILLLLSIGFILAIRYSSINHIMTDAQSIIIIACTAISFIISVCFFVAMCNTDDSDYHYPIIDYPADVQFLLLSKKYRIKDVDVKKHFSTTRLVITGVDKDKNIQRDYIEIPNQCKSNTLDAPVLDLIDETYYIPFSS